MKSDDADLAAAARDGDAIAFTALLERHYDRLFRLAFRLTGTRDAAEDLTQDVCAALPGKLAGYRGEAQVSSWLYRVMVNAAHDRRRRLAAHAKAAVTWGEREVSRRHEVAETKAAVDWLHNAMAHLPDDLRDTLALVLDDLTQAQAAEILGVSEGTVAWRMSEVKKRLRAMERMT